MATPVDLILVPWDSAQRNVRMGAGPEGLLAAGLLERFEREDVAVRTVRVEPEKPFLAEIATAFDLCRGVRRAAEASRRDGRLPLTLSGNCHTGVIGSLAAEPSDDIGLFWFDAHSDAATPESSASGFLDAMGLAIALGRCFRPQLDAVGGAPLDGRRAVHVGGREVLPQPRALLDEAGVTLVPPEVARSQPAEAALGGAIEAVKAAGARRVHIHVDLDVLDPDLVGPANEYALPGGVTAPQLNALLETILGEFQLASASIASYGPSLDRNGAVAAAGLDALSLFATAWSASSR